MNRARPSVNIQVRLKYQNILKNLAELGPGIYHRSAQASPGRGYLGPRAAGPPSNARDNPVAWGSGWVPGPAGPRGRRHGRPLADSARHAAGLRRPGGPARADGRQASGPKTAGVRRHASGRRQHRTATEEPVITMIFQNRCWVSGPGVEFTGNGGEERLSVKRAGRLLLGAPRSAARVPGLRGVMRWDRRSSFSGKGGRTMDGSRARRTRDRARRAWYAGWRQYRFARHYGFLSGTTTSGPDLRSRSPSEVWRGL